jgi:hypothetical protein
MDQRSIVLYLDRNGWMARVIHDDLVATLCEEAMAYITVRKYLHEAQPGPDDASALPEDFDAHIDNSDEAILGTLEELPFSSVRKLSHATYLRKTTVYRQLCEKLDFTERHLRWVLISSLRQTRQRGSKVHSPF